MKKFAYILFLWVVISCEMPSRQYGEASKPLTNLPDQQADTIDVVYSEGGIPKFELHAPTLIMRETAQEQYNEFPNGIAVDFYNKEGEKNANLTALYGYDNQNERQRFVRDSVKIISLKDGWIYQTSELYIDEKKDSVYNNGKYVRITKPDGTFIQGYGFVSDTRMEKIRVNNIFNSTLPVNDNHFLSKPNPTKSRPIE